MFHTPDFIKNELTRSQMNAAITASLAGLKHNDLQNIQGGSAGEYYHLTSAQNSGLTGGLATALHTHDHNNLTSIQGGQAAQYYHLTSAEYTGTGSGPFVRQTSPALVTPTLGVAIGTSLDLTGTLNVQGDTTLGDTAADSITQNAGVITIASDYTSTRTKGTAAAGTSQLMSHVTTADTNVAGNSAIRAVANQFTVSGSSASGIHTLYRTSLGGNATAAMGGLTGYNVSVAVTNTANAAIVIGYETSFAATSSGNLSNVRGFNVGVNTLTSTGNIGTIQGYICDNIGHATLVSNAYGFRCLDLTGSVTATRGFFSSVSSGTGKHNIYADGTAPSYHEGDFKIGNATARTIENANKLQITGITAAAASLGISKWSADTLGARIELGKSRGAAIGTNTIVVSGDRLGSITAYGNNGSTFSNAAAIVFTSDGTPGASADMPGAITLSTCADGSATLTDRWIVKAAGNLLAGTDNSWDIGAAGATRPRTGYFATSILTPLHDSGAASAISFSTNTGTKQVEVSHTASASRYLTLTGSNGGNPTIGVSAGDLAITPNIVGAGSIKTAAPNTGTAGAWKLGSLVGGQIGLVVIATQYIELDIGGTLYKLATV